MKAISTLLLLAVFLTTTIKAQEIKSALPLDLQAKKVVNTNKSAVLTATFLGEINPQTSDKNWHRLFKSETKSHKSGANHELVQQIKAEKQLQREAQNKNLPLPGDEEANGVEAANPVVVSGFLGNEMYDGTPTDNALTISNGGKIVSSDNTTIEYYDQNGNYISTYVTHFDFLGSTLTGSIFDPKLVYDSGSDRFIFVILHGSDSNSSLILVCFSKTNNPSDGWWLYSIQGATSHPGCWFDYPSIGISNNELYISGNLYTNGNDQFNGNVVYQIPKQAGYDGGQMQYQYWKDVVDGDGNIAFTLAPLSKGQQGNYGPGVYLVSNSSSGSNKVHLYDLTDDMSSSNEQLNSYAINSTSYSPGAYANMQGSNSTLNTGDCRVLSGFYLNGFAHFVFTSDVGGTWNGVNYNRINLSAGTNSSSTFGQQGSLDYAYPAVASISSSASDKSVIINFLASGPSIYPGIRAVNCDNNMNWSQSVAVKDGESHIAIGGNPERWGDYIALARKYNSSPPEVWSGACYGVASNFALSNTYNAWVAKIRAGSGGGSGIGFDELEAGALQVYPNPVVDLFTVEIDLKEQQWIDISLYDMEGSLVKQLYTDRTNAGKSTLSFNKNALSSGSYNLLIKNNEKILKNEKIVVVQ